MLRLIKSFLILCCVFSLPILAQTQDEQFSLKPKIEINPPYCEFNILELEGLAREIKSNEFLIIISHLGVGERKEMGFRRLYNAKYFFIHSPNNRPVSSILTAEGESVNGKGYIDFYVKGELELRIYIKKNAELIVTSCISDPPDKRCSPAREKQFYPCR